MSIKLSTLTAAVVQFTVAYLVALPIFLLFKLARTLLRRPRRGRELPSAST
jgi:hypothetical protein